MPCTNGCVINSQTGGDHAYCECECHVGSLPAIPPSRERRVIGFDVPGYSALDKVVDERNALRDEVNKLRSILNAALSDRYQEHSAGECYCWFCEAQKLISPVK